MITVQIVRSQAVQMLLLQFNTHCASSWEAARTVAPIPAPLPILHTCNQPQTAVAAMSALSQQLIELQKQGKLTGFVIITVRHWIVKPTPPLVVCWELVC